MIFSELSTLLFPLFLLVLTGLAIFFAFKYFRRHQCALQQIQQQNEQLIRQELWQEQLLELKAQHAKLTEELSQLQPLTGVLQSTEAQLEALKQQLKQKESEIIQLREELKQSSSRTAQLSTELENEKNNAQEKLALLESTKAQLANEFEVLSNRIFESKQAQFTQHTQERMDAILKPIQGSLESFKQRVELVHKEDLKERASLSEQLRHLHVLNH